MRYPRFSGVREAAHRGGIRVMVDIQQAIRACHEGRFEEAERLCRQILAALPRQPQASLLLGHALLRTGRVGEADEVTAAAIGSNPGHPDLLTQRGEVLARLGARRRRSSASRNPSIDASSTRGRMPPSRPCSPSGGTRGHASRSRSSPLRPAPARSSARSRASSPRTIPSSNTSSLRTGPSITIACGDSCRDGRGTRSSTWHCPPIPAAMVSAGTASTARHLTSSMASTSPSWTRTTGSTRTTWPPSWRRSRPRGWPGHTPFERSSTPRGDSSPTTIARAWAAWPTWNDPNGHLVDVNCYMLRRDLAIAVSPAVVSVLPRRGEPRLRDLPATAQGPSPLRHERSLQRQLSRREHRRLGAGRFLPDGQRGDAPAIPGAASLRDAAVPG